MQLRLSTALDEEVRKAMIRGAASPRYQEPAREFQKFLDLAMCPKQKYAAHVVSSKVMRAIEKDSHPSGSRTMHDQFLHYAGLRITEKTDQRSPCFAFVNIKDANRYLNGEVTEDELIASTKSKAT